MNSRAVGWSGLVVVLAGVVAAALFPLMQYGVWRPTWINLDAAAVCVAVICLVGCVLGWCSFRTKPGLVAATVGTLLITLLIVYCAFEFLRGMAISGMPPPSD